MVYTVLDTDQKIKAKVDEWKGAPLAVDFECEYNLHIYGEHLSIVQIYDRSGYYIIDNRASGVTPSGLEYFFSSPQEKIWFDIQGDASLLYKKYRLRINNVFDVRVPAVLLGYKGNLLSLIEIFLGKEIDIDKKKNQQANWLERPLDMALIEYALNDVKYLFDLKDVLLEEIKKKKLEKEMKRSLEHVTRVKEPVPGWRHIGDWRKMKKNEKENLKKFYTARDNIARRFNVPASRVLDKHTLLSLSLDPPRSREELHIRIEKEPQRFRRLLEDALWKEIRRDNQP